MVEDEPDGDRAIDRRALLRHASLAVAVAVLGASYPATAVTGSAARRTVLFLHSLAGSPSHWRLQATHLDGRAIVSAPFWPGHGGVPLPDGPPSFEAVAKALALRLGLPKRTRLLIVGHSAGASVALSLAAGLGERVDGLVLVDPSGDMRGEPPEEAKRTDAFLASLRSSDYRETVTKFWRRMLRGAKPATETMVLRDLAAGSQETVIYCMEAFRRFDPGRHLAALRCPVQAVFSPLNAGPGSLADQHPELPSTFLHDVSHWLHIDAPGRFNQLLDSMLEQVRS